MSYVAFWRCDASRSPVRRSGRGVEGVRCGAHNQGVEVGALPDEGGLGIEYLFVVDGQGAGTEFIIGEADLTKHYRSVDGFVTRQGVDVSVGRSRKP